MRFSLILLVYLAVEAIAPAAPPVVKRALPRPASAGPASVPQSAVPAADDGDVDATGGDQQFLALRKQLAVEEAKLKRRLAELARMRQQAIQSRDNKRLQAIEQQERDTIGSYEAAINRIFAGVSQAEPKPAGTTPAASAKSGKRDGGEQSKQQRPPNRRRFWFFGP